MVSGRQSKAKFLQGILVVLGQSGIDRERNRPFHGFCQFLKVDDVLDSTEFIGLGLDDNAFGDLV